MSENVTATGVSVCCNMLRTKGSRKHGDEPGVTWPQCMHLGCPNTVQGMLHSHLLVAPQPDQARHSPAQASARPWVTQQTLQSMP